MPALNQPSAAHAVRRRQQRRVYGVLFLAMVALALGLLWRSDYNQALIVTENDPAAEIVALNAAFERYRQLWGEYPPNFDADEDVLRQHLKLRFPGMSAEESLPPTVDAAEALVFWLGGFSASRRFPFTGGGGPLSIDGPRRKGIYDFDPARLVPTSHGKQVYVPPGLGRTEPYVYFLTTGQRLLQYPAQKPRIEAYRQNEEQYVNRTSFQVLSAGEDDRWGELPAPRYPAGPFTSGHADNRANFAPSLLGDPLSGAAPRSE